MVRASEVDRVAGPALGPGRWVVMFAGLLLATSAARCGGGPRPSASPVPDEPPRARPDSGPWFVDRARDYGLDVVTTCGGPEKRSVVESLGTGLTLFDADNDGDLDLFVAGTSRVEGGTIRPAGGPWLFRNDGPGRWVDVSAPSGLHHTGWSQAVAPADYDGDGDLDLFVAQLGPDVLWRNQGDGTFRDVTQAAGLRDAYWGVGATWGDVDGDGWPDLYVTNYLEADPIHPEPPIDYLPGFPVFRGPTALPGQPDLLWRNRGDGTFEDVTARSGVARPDGKGMAALFADLDDDGRLDLFVTNDTQSNDLFRGLGDGRFHQVAHEAGVALNPMGIAEGSMGIDVADVDGDGRLDLAFTNFRHEGTRLYRNLGHHLFEDISTGSFVGVNTLRFVGWGLILVDFDNDGWPDLFQANGHVYPGVPDADYDQPLLFLKNTGEARFEPATETWGPSLDRLRSGRGAAVGDLDNDGDLDLVVSTIDGPLRVLVNEGRRTSNAVQIRLVGQAPRREAIGTRLEIQAGGRTQIGVVRRGGAFLSASDLTLHFGLADASSIDRVTIRWPGGRSQTHARLPVNARLTIREAEAAVAVAPFLTPIDDEAATP